MFRRLWPRDVSYHRAVTPHCKEFSWRQFLTHCCFGRKQILSNNQNLNLPKTTDSYGDTALHAASLRDNLGAAEMLIAMGCDVKALEKGRRSPLHYAAESGNLKVIEALIEAGNDALEEKDISTKTSLQFAETVELLCANGADVTARDKYNSTLLHYAALVSSCAVMELIIAKGGLIDAADSGCSTPLHWAAEHDQIRAVEKLISLGCNVNALDKDGMNALHRACNAYHLDPFGHYYKDYVSNAEIVRKLVASGCDVNAVDLSGETPLDYAKERGLEEAVKILINKMAQQS